MTRQLIIEQITQAREVTLGTVAGVDEALICQPATLGEWSVKDTLLHLSRWEAELVKLLFQVRQGVEPQSPIFADDFLKYNEVWWAEGKDRALEDVYTDLDAVRQQLMRRLGEFSDADLDAADKYAWMKGHSLGELVIDLCVGHESHHNRELVEWRKKLA